ncbi:MAG: hypothetical protein LUD52_01730 [Opitutae bacterium]|nr:hypothetical protein [Opitutae bacterium]
MKKAFLSLAFSSLALASACTTDHGTFPVLSNKIVDIEEFELGTAQQIKHVGGKHEAFIVYKLTIGDVNLDLGEALNECFSDNDADVLVNAQITETWFWIPYICGYYGVDVEGDAVKTRRD